MTTGGTTSNRDSTPSTPPLGEGPAAIAASNPAHPAHPGGMSLFTQLVRWAAGLALTGIGAAGQDYDLLVYGGTPGGIATAVSAARAGATVLLIEPSSHLGGMTTGGLSHTDVGPKPDLLGGFAREFYTRADAKYPASTRTKANFWYHEPHVAEQVFTELLREARVTMVFGRHLATVTKTAARITALTTTDGTTHRARYLADATYEGDLMARAGVDFVIGRESAATYGEKFAGFRPAPLRPRTPAYMAAPGSAYTHGTPVKISAYQDGRLLPGLNTAWPAPGSGDRRSQSYNYRVIVTADPANRVPFPKPANYDPLRYEILARIIDAYPGIHFEKLVYLGPLPNGKFDANASGLVQGTDHVGANVDYADGDRATRERIRLDHVAYTQGFFWFLAHDPRVPAALRAQASQWGLAKDEFTDNAHWPYALYVREARRLLGATVLREQDCTRQVTKPDSIGMGAFILDSHAVQRLVDPDGNVIDEGNFDHGTRPYQIPYRCITPQKAQCENLLVPVALSASHVAYGSVRMEPQFMIIGHAAGLAAVMALRQDGAVQDVDVPALQATLLGQKQVLALTPTGPTLAAFGGTVLDDDGATFTGEWPQSSFGDPLEGSSHHDANEGKGTKTARFELTVPKAGRYEVRLAYTAAPNRADRVPVTVRATDGTTVVMVNQKVPPPLGGHFVALGTFPFTADQPALVIVANTATNGFVSVDAVQLVEAPRG